MGHVDELLSTFYGWKVVTDATLIVKHLKPTGANYNKTARYKLKLLHPAMGFIITAIASAKLSFMKKPLLFSTIYKVYKS
jgi:hypothetical protein